MKNEIRSLHQFGEVFCFYLTLLYLGFGLFDFIDGWFFSSNEVDKIGRPYETAPLHMARFVLSLGFLGVFKALSQWSLEVLSLPLWGLFLFLVIHHYAFSVNPFLIPAFDVLIFSMAYIQCWCIDEKVKEMILFK